MRQEKMPKEFIRLLYNLSGSTLYGHVSFYRKQQEGKGKPACSDSSTLIQHRGSEPFVIGKYLPEHADGTGSELLVYGSVDFFLREIQRLVNEFIKTNKDWWVSTKDTADEQCKQLEDFRYESHVMDFIILVSTHARNLFHMLNDDAFNKKTISKLNYDNEPDGNVRLGELFDILIHNRYYYFDGARIRDIFSEKFKKGSTLSGRFMGYGIDLTDFVNGIVDVLNAIKVNHLTRLLRAKFNKLSSKSSPQDIVFLVQNFQSFSELMKKKIPASGGQYDFMMQLMFGGVKATEHTIWFQSPNINIHRDLSKKEVEIRVKYSTKNKSAKMETKEVSVGYINFFNKVDSSFGEDNILSGSQNRISFTTN